MLSIEKKGKSGYLIVQFSDGDTILMYSMNMLLLSTSRILNIVRKGNRCSSELSIVRTCLQT